MKKLKKPVPKSSEEPFLIQEQEVLYAKLRQSPALKDLTYNDFKKVADKAPFTQSEWAAILHVSERTLQRYAKDNHRFAAINAERFEQVNFVIKRAKDVFGDINKFYRWLRQKPVTLEGNISLASLSSYDGISTVLMQLGRIEHGILA